MGLRGGWVLTFTKVRQIETHDAVYYHDLYCICGTSVTRFIHVPCADGHINMCVHVPRVSRNPFRSRNGKAAALNRPNETRLYNLFSRVSSQIHVTHFNQGSPLQHVSLQVWSSLSTLHIVHQKQMYCTSWVQPRSHRNITQIYGVLLKVDTQTLGTVGEENEMTGRGGA